MIPRFRLIQNKATWLRLCVKHLDGCLLKYGFVLMLFLTAISADAKVTLWQWQPSPNHATFLLPRLNNEAPAQSVLRYVYNLNLDIDLHALMNGPVDYPLGEISEFAGNKDDSHAILFANDARDLTADPKRIENFARPLRKQGFASYIIPPAAEIGLQEEDAQEFADLVAQSSPLFVALGGDDVDPGVFNRKNLFSRNLNAKRDLAEARIIRSVLKYKTGFLAGVCRGHQLILSILSDMYVLVQDLEEQLKVESHENVVHSIKILGAKLLRKVLSSLPKGQANSIHHQGFHNLPKNGPVNVVATDENGIVEATEFKDGMGATFQFHPELMDERTADLFAEALVKGAKRAVKEGPRVGRIKAFSEEDPHPICKDILL